MNEFNYYLLPGSSLNHGIFFCNQAKIIDYNLYENASIKLKKQMTNV